MRLFDKAKSVLDGIIKKSKPVIHQLKLIDCDLVICTEHHPTCEICAPYQGRVFSISGRDTRFMRLPPEVLQSGRIHEGCAHSFHGWIESLQEPHEIRQAIAFSNLPFTDCRTEDERELFERHQAYARQHEKDVANYSELLKLLPDICPKSFSGYRRMRNMQSANFLKLKEEAEKQGLDL